MRLQRALDSSTCGWSRLEVRRDPRPATEQIPSYRVVVGCLWSVVCQRTRWCVFWVRLAVYCRSTTPSHDHPLWRLVVDAHPVRRVAFPLTARNKQPQRVTFITVNAVGCSFGALVRLFQTHPPADPRFPQRPSPPLVRSNPLLLPRDWILRVYRNHVNVRVCVLVTVARVLWVQTLLSVVVPFGREALQGG